MRRDEWNDAAAGLVRPGMNIEIWSDIACPWCYIGKRRFEAALERFPHRDDVSVTWRSFQLDPSLPDHYDGSELDYLSERKGLARSQAASMFQHVSAQAAGVGLHYDFDRLVVANSFMAHRFLHVAKEAGVGDAAKERLLSGHFERGEDIGSIDALVAVGVELGLDATMVRDTLVSDRYASEVRDDIADGQALGVSGVPFFVFDRTYGVSGAQPTEVFTDTLTKAWAESHPLTIVGDADGSACGPDGCAI